jgi:hypothetical protein
MASETRPTPERKWWLRPSAAVVISSLVGIVLFRWEWLLNSAGFHIAAERPGVLAFEYWIGLPIAALLGFVFSRGPEPLVAGISLMWGATTINHIAYIASHGVPNLWPIELALVGALTIPYIVAAFGGSYVQRRISRKNDAI